MRVTFCGVGAIGSHALLLCRGLEVNLACVDGDRVESKNVLSQAYVKQSVGKHKAEALRLQLLNFHGRTIDAFPVRLDATNVAVLCRDSGLLVDCFDNATSRNILTTHSRASGTPLVHAGISDDGSFGLIRWDERFVADDPDEHGAATCQGAEHLAMIGLLAGTLAVVVRDFVTDGRQRDMTVTAAAITTTHG